MPQPANKKPKAEPAFDPTAKLDFSDADEFLAQEGRREKALRMQELVRPGRTTPIAVRFDQFTLKRLRALAALRNTGYQTLLKEFIVERLYEEEKREGIIKS
ncbi:MAG: CopG family antitoxin [Solirubrobacteraceae bacterium]